MGLLKGSMAIPLPLGRKVREGRKNLRYSLLRIGRISRIDYVEWVADIEWIDFQGGRTEVPLSCMMGSFRTFGGFMPEERSLVVCGFVRHTEFEARPIVIAYLPNGFLTGYDFNPVVPPEEDANQIRCRMQKLYPGEGFLQSTQGSWMRMDHHFQVYASDLSGIFVDAFTHSVNIRALTKSTRTAVGKSVEGLVIRNGAPEASGSAEVPPMILPNTKEHHIVTVDNSSLDEGGVPWVESRELVRETSDGVMDVTEEFEDDDQIYDDVDNHLIEIVKGTLIGDNPNDAATYARVLRRKIFGSATATTQDLGYEEVSSEDEKKSIAVCPLCLYLP